VRVKDPSRPWRLFAAVSVGTFMSTLDSSIVNVSLPTISRHFHIDLSIAQWVALAYLITVAAVLLPVGAFIDLMGRGRAYTAGLVLFTVGSLLCGRADSEHLLIGSRVVQALGAAVLMASGMALLIDAWPPEERGRVMGLGGAVVSVGLLTGPPLGGLISGTLGWRWIFYVNLPVGVLGLCMALAAFRGRSDARGRLDGFDVPGAVALGAFMVALCLGLTFGQRNGWAAPATLGLLGACPLLGALFLWRQRTAARPLVDLGLFANATFSSAAASSLLSFIGQFPLFLFLPFYLEGVLGYSQKATGMTIFLVPLLSAALAPVTGRLSDRVGTLWPTVAAQALRVAGYGIILTFGLHVAHGWVLAALALMGLGNAAFGPANQSALMGAAPPAHRGLASGLASLVRSLGMVIGAAVATAVAGSQAAAAHAGGGAALDAARNPAAFVHGFHAAMLLSLLATLAAGIAAACRPSDARRQPATVPKNPLSQDGSSQ
jgi:EmrB/QacA subfamily drug resistance transporter